MVSHMKTTLNIDDSIMRRLREEAARQGCTMSELVEAGLRLVLEGPSGAAGTVREAELPPLPSRDSGGARVDVANREALYTLIDTDRAVVVVDTNVLLYAADESSEFDLSCRDLLERARRKHAPWFLTWSICHEEVLDPLRLLWGTRSLRSSVPGVAFRGEGVGVTCPLIAPELCQCVRVRLRGSVQHDAVVFDRDLEPVARANAQRAADLGGQHDLPARVDGSGRHVGGSARD